MQRILIIGCPGAGKTTFARKLAEKTALPLVHLDKFYHDNRFDYRTDAEAWYAEVRALTSRPRWIMDGNYKSTFDIRMSRADTIIYLDYPTWLTVMRAYKRRIYFHKTVRPDMPTNWEERLDRTFLRFILQYRRVVRPQVLILLERYREGRTIYVCSSPQELEVLLHSL
jgi:adenylate kinase family enzyme